MVQSQNRTVTIVRSLNKEDKKQDNERWIFCFLSKKEDSTPLKGRLIDYYQDEEMNAIVDDYPSVHTTLQQSFGE